MPYKDKKKQNAAVKEAMRRKRAGITQEKVIETVTPKLNPKSETVNPIKQEDIDNLPLSLKFQLDAITRSRRILKMPDNLKERQEAAVRHFRGY